MENMKSISTWLQGTFCTRAIVMVNQARPSTQKTWWLLGLGTVAAASLGAFWYRTKMARERHERRVRKRANNVNIGAVFGMDVGGTLAKVVYFERDLPPDAPTDEHEHHAANIPRLRSKMSRWDLVFRVFTKYQACQKNGPRVIRVPHLPSKMK